jgi:hypothetical protein
VAELQLTPAEADELRQFCGLAPDDELTAAAVQAVLVTANVLETAWIEWRSGSRIWRWPDQRP